MAKEEKIVEVTVTSDGGEQIPVGIMNAKQASSLPDDIDISICDLDQGSAATEGIADLDDHAAQRRPAGRPAGQTAIAPFPAPTEDVPAARVAEARILMRDVLAELLASANEAGWGTQEIISVIISAAQEAMDAYERDPDPADDSNLPNRSAHDIGSGERFR